MDASSIEYVLQELGCDKIKVKSNTVQSSCPFAPWTHADGIDKHPSFGVDINASGTSKWGCFSCGNGANQTYSLIYRYCDYSGSLKQSLLDYIKDREGSSMSFRLSKMEWRASRPLQNPQFVPTRLTSYEPTYLLENYRDVLSYLPQYALDRDISPQQAMDWNIGWLRYGMQLADGYRSSADRLFFSIFSHDKKMVGWSGRRISDEPWSNGAVPPKYHHAPDMKKERYLYGEHKIDKSIRHAFICESFMDVLRLDSFGVKNPLAIMGASASFEQIKKLSEWFEEIYILRHADKAGLDMAETMANQLTMIGVRAIIVEPIEGKKDAGEWTKDETYFVLNSQGVQNGCSSTEAEKTIAGSEETPSHGRQ